jgi:pyruvate dehydrogenase E2 component (dihydrolipoamide acetyltransferase)
MVITMPQLGETVTEGTIVHWYKAVGDDIAEDEALFDVSTDKVDSEVPSPATGVIREILVAEGDTVPVGTPLVVVTTNDATDDAHDDAHDDAAHAAIPVVAATPPAPPARAVRSESIGSGARVTRSEVAERIAARERPLARPATGPAPAPVPERTRVQAGHGDQAEPFTTARRRTAEHMVRSLATSAHTLVVMEVDYAAVDRARDSVGETFRVAEGFGLTYLPFIARAVVDAVREFPRVNASVADDALIVHPDVHLGVAVDLDFEGLIVPVIRDAGQLRLTALARTMRERSTAARERRLGPDDLAGGTFTLTNAGGYGTLLTAPIISQPQVAIISTDSVSMRPVAVPLDGGSSPKYGIAVHPVGNLALSFDHRAFDGAYASAFLRSVVSILESRDWLEELA